VRPISNNSSEIESLIIVDNEAFKENMINIYTAKTFIQYGKVFGLFEGNRLFGFTIFMRSWSDPNLAYLKKMAIASNHRGKGYGKRLLSQSLQEIKNDHISRVVLTVNPNNPPALQLYQKIFHFKVLEKRIKEYGEGQDRLFLELNIDSFHTEMINE
jgi:ribosomal-protein-alanine N-acetyltransferase